MTKAVILTSGGINSTVAAAIAREHYEPALLHIAWGHRAAERERTCFDFIAANLRIEHTRVVELSCAGLFAANPRVNKRLSPEEQPGQIPASFAVGLLPTMLSVAASWAASIGATRILVGISEDHGVSGPCISELYPDYKREFVQTFNLMLHYARYRDRELVVEAPLLELSRPEVVKLADLMHLPLDHTWSCQTSADEPCCRCIGCTTRAEGFLQAGIADPLLLAAHHA